MTSKRERILKVLRTRGMMPTDLHEEFLDAYPIDYCADSDDPLVQAYTYVCLATNAVERALAENSILKKQPASVFDVLNDMVDIAILEPKGYPKHMTLMALRDYLAMTIMLTTRRPDDPEVIWRDGEIEAESE